MSAFEFLFSFYGLLLGLSIAELAAGFSRAWDRRSTAPVGWLAPLLGLLLVQDLVSFWTNAWDIRQRIEVNYYVALASAAVALIYYFAATQVFPRDGSTSSSDDHVMAHRKAVVIAVMLSNGLASLGGSAILGLGPMGYAFNLLLNLPYFALLVAIGWMPGRRALHGLLVFTVVGMPFYTTVMLALVRALSG